MGTNRFAAPLLALLIALTGCVDAPEGSMASQCGPRPDAPGAAVALSGDTATMSRDTWLSLLAWREDISQWSVCAESWSVSQ